MNYSLRQLRVFVTVAHARSFSRAGDIIGLSQSAVSHSVKELELQTGVRLLDRTTREVVLTEAGQQLAARLERLLDELNNTLRDAGRVGQQLSGTVRVAASQTISAHLIPQCIAQSNRLYPRSILCCMIDPNSGYWRVSAMVKWTLASLSIPVR
jgi:DNA-binding transcriptional LysR family regulator